MTPYIQGGSSPDRDCKIDGNKLSILGPPEKGAITPHWPRNIDGIFYVFLRKKITRSSFFVLFRQMCENTSCHPLEKVFKYFCKIREKIIENVINTHIMTQVNS